MASSLFADRYRLEDVLSTTVMADVRTATDVVLDRRVVVKLLAPEADHSRFEREAQAAAALAHAHIVQVFDYGEAEGRPYIVFEYLPGGSLETRLADGRALPDDETARVASDIAAGLAHAHERGVVHRDLKPGNVLFDAEDRAKIADFGIAQLAGAVTLTDAGTVLGTATYISPEQTRGETATPASDVYSFGVVLYRMLTGRLPFESESPVELATMHRDADPPDVRSVRRDVPAELAAVAMAALAKEPGLRPANGDALMRSLTSGGPAEVATDAATLPLPVAEDALTEVVGPTPPPDRQRRRLSPLVAGLIGALLLAAGGAVAAVLLTNGGSSAPAVTEPTPGPRPTTAPTATTAATTATATTTPATTTTAPRPTTTAPATSPPTSPTTTVRTTTAATTPTVTTTPGTTTAATTTAETTTAETTTAETTAAAATPTGP
jgi:eukaryotic-like serine/threonine-protein kinase